MPDLQTVHRIPKVYFNKQTLPQIAICGRVRRTFVVDGDTSWLDGTKFCIADIDTPETSQHKCDFEFKLGMQATRRLVDLLNAGPFELRTIGNRDED